MANVLKKEYTQVQVYGDLDEVMEVLGRKTVPCYCMFSGIMLTTDDTVDTAYIKVCGMTKREYENALKKDSRKRALKRFFRI